MQLLSFNQFSANKGTVLTRAVRAVLGHDIPTLALRRDQAVWREAADQLGSEGPST